MLCGMLATWNVAKPFPNHILFSASPPSSSFSFGPDLERKGVRGKLHSKTNPYFSNHWVFSLSLGPFCWLSPYPFVIPLVGFSKCLQTARDTSRPGLLKKLCWTAISWRYWSPSLLPIVGFYVSEPACGLSQLLNLRQRTCGASFWSSSSSIDTDVSSSVWGVSFITLFFFFKYLRKLFYSTIFICFLYNHLTQ